MLQKLGCILAPVSGIYGSKVFIAMYDFKIHDANDNRIVN